MLMIVGFIGHASALHLDHNPVTTTDNYGTLTMNAENQPMVDHTVSIRVTYNQTAIVIVTKGDMIVGQGLFGHKSNILFPQLPAKGVTEHVLIHLNTSIEVINHTLTATVYQDLNGNGKIDASDTILQDTTGSNLQQTFVVTASYPATIKVQNQEVNLNNPYIMIDEIIIPGPSWLVIHGFDKGSLGMMYGVKEQLRHGINIQIQYDFDQQNLKDMGLNKAGDTAKLFVHIHHDNILRGVFNASVDTHIQSPAFSDQILGNETVMLFTVTAKVDNSALPVPAVVMALSLLALPLLFKYKSH